MLFMCYPRCSTCRKAKAWLEENGIEFKERHMVEENPNYEELKDWCEKSGLGLKKFFNTSGLIYKELKLKDKLHEMDEKAQLEILASNGMLVKRPILVTKDRVLVGFKEEEWREALNK